ncbi:MAG: hypothetical protein Q8Q81_12320 [Oxalobacteraceae bacterium]|nr:hypothetical protein [Oxalobacteraceae bacterium]
MSLAWGRLRAAVTALSGAESQRERLINAYISLICLKHKDLPAEIRTDFDALMNGVTFCSIRETQQVARDKVNQLDDAQVISMIILIIDMYDLTTRYQPLAPADKGRPVAASGQ